MTSPREPGARRLVAAVTHDTEATAAAWEAMGPSVLEEASWPEFLVLALQHRVAGLVCDALQAVGWLDRIPLTIQDDLLRRAATAELRHELLSGAFAELAALEPDAVASAVLFKGSTIYAEYASPAHRIMSDYDLILSEEHFRQLEPRFAELGYYRKESLNGPTYYRDVEVVRARGVDPAASDWKICIDVHVIGPSKYNREESALVEDWLLDSRPYELAGVPCRRLDPGLQLINLVTHIHEHAASWMHAVLDDDIRLIRVLDVELLADRTSPSAAGTWERARALGLHGEFASGLWHIAKLRPSLPEALLPLDPLVELTGELGELYASPGWGLARWPVPLAERAFRTDRIDLAFAVAPPGTPRRWGEWYSATQGFLLGGGEDVKAVGARVGERVAGFVPAALAPAGRG